MSLQRPFMASAVFVALPGHPLSPLHRTPDPTHFRPAFTHNCSGRTFVGQVSSQVLAAVGSTIKNVQTCIIKIKNFISPDTFLRGFPPKKERQEMCEKPRKNSAEKCS